MQVGNKTGGVCALAVLLCTARVDAVPVVNVGAHDLLANTPGQTITLFISDPAPNTTRLAGEDFVVQLADGNGTQPKITGVDLLTGTVFAANNNGQRTFAGGNFPQAQGWGTATDANNAATFVNDNGKLATITIDTTGVNSGTFSFSIGAGSTRLGPTSFFNDQANDIPATITDGTITVPEPSAAGLLALLASGAVMRHRRRGGAQK
jgi:hypothetical protein